jgi:hypothetical protein
VDNAVRIDRVQTRRQFRLYRDFPRRVYKNDPNWVPPLNVDFKAKLDKKKNPFFEHADRELFLAWRDGRPAGRVAAIIDDNHNSHHDEKVVFFGQYESFNDPETARALLEAAASWGRERGMTTLRGPVNLSLNDECAFLLEGYDSPPMVMMPYNPPYYHDLMAACGLVKAKDLLAFRMFRDHEIHVQVQAIVDKLRKETGVRARNFDIKKWREESERVKYIYNHAWERNWGFVPWTEHEMDHMIQGLRPLADPRLIIILEDQGRPIGLGFGFPNYNEVLSHMNGRMTPLSILKFLWYKRRIKGVRFLVFGIIKEYRLSGASYLLFSRLEQGIVEGGYQWAETSWQLEDNEAVNKFVASIGGRVYKKYRIYEKQLA